MDREPTSTNLSENTPDAGLAFVSPPRELSRPYNVQDVLRQDLIAPPAALMEASDYSLGTPPVDVERYLTREFHDLEVKHMWSRVWQFAAWTYDIPKPGDVAVYRNVDQSILIVRQRDGSLKAFVNSCLHRGREICEADGRRARLRCPYHGFTWGLEGDLQWTPAEWDFPQVKAETFALPQVRVEEWNGFIFVNLDDQAPSLAQYMGRMQTDWKDWDFRNKYKAVHVEKLINCNWKVCMEGFIESFHVFASHPQIAAMVPESSVQYDIWPDEPHVSRFHAVTGLPSTAMTQVPEEQDVVDAFTSAYLPEIYGTEDGKLRPGETARQAFARVSRKVYMDRMGLDVSDMPESELIDGTEYLLFPNFVPWASLANPIVYRFRPGDGPDWCIWETMLFLPFAGERPPSAKVIKVGPNDSLADVKELGYLDYILQQDAEQLPLVQRGLKASKTRKLTLSQYQESRIRHYNQTIDAYIAGRI